MMNIIIIIMIAFAFSYLINTFQIFVKIFYQLKSAVSVEKVEINNFRKQI